jgi:hypothetical protein
MTKLSLYHSLLGFPRVDTWAGNKWFCWLLIVLVEKQECSCMLLEEKLPSLQEAQREGPTAEIIWLHRAIILWVGGLVANTPNLPRLPSLLLLLLLISWKDRQTKELWITWLEQVCLKLISKKCMKRCFLYLRRYFISNVGFFLCQCSLAALCCCCVLETCFWVGFEYCLLEAYTQKQMNVWIAPLLSRSRLYSLGIGSLWFYYLDRKPWQLLQNYSI